MFAAGAAEVASTSTATAVPEEEQEEEQACDCDAEEQSEQEESADEVHRICRRTSHSETITRHQAVQPPDRTGLEYSGCGCECDSQRRKPRYTSDNLYIKLSICHTLKGGGNK
ncbi:hypothetical protein PAMA_009919 [Pampus argenteus]